MRLSTLRHHFNDKLVCGDFQYFIDESSVNVFDPEVTFFSQKGQRDAAAADVSEAGTDRLTGRDHLIVRTVIDQASWNQPSDQWSQL